VGGGVVVARFCDHGFCGGCSGFAFVCGDSFTCVGCGGGGEAHITSFS